MKPKNLELTNIHTNFIRAVAPALTFAFLAACGGRVDFVKSSITDNDFASTVTGINPGPNSFTNGCNPTNGEQYYWPELHAIDTSGSCPYKTFTYVDWCNITSGGKPFDQNQETVVVGKDTGATKITVQVCRDLDDKPYIVTTTQETVFFDADKNGKSDGSEEYITNIEIID